MYYFENDYQEGAHPDILKAMVEANLVQTLGYGDDVYTRKAEDIIKQTLNNENVDVHLFVGGTITNIVGLSSFLRPWEAIICTDEGHIETHETGAIEATGHELLAIPNKDGKLDPADIEELMKKHTTFHNVIPRCVFIANATELGTMYTLEEVKALRAVCDKYDLYLYMDGARMACAMAHEDNDITYEDLCELCDMFYIGATKIGALYGEALVIVNDQLKPYFRYNMKQKGSIYAKHKYLAIQFIELFSNDLINKLARHANKCAQKLRQGFIDNGFEMFLDTKVNQLFPIIDNDIFAEFEKEFMGQKWCEHNENQVVVRYTTSWCTDEKEVDKFVQLIEKYKRK